MKKSCYFLILLIAVLAGCKKDDNKNNDPAINTWVLDNQTFTAKAVFLSTGGSFYPVYLNIVDDTPITKNVLHIDFTTMPVKSGPLRIAHDAYAPDEIRLFYTGTTGYAYGYLSVPDAGSTAYIDVYKDRWILTIRNALLKEFSHAAATSMRLNTVIEVKR